MGGKALMCMKDIIDMNRNELLNEAGLFMLIFENKYLGITYDIEDGRISRSYERTIGGRCV
jgi:hypothetical protein